MAVLRVAEFFAAEQTRIERSITAFCGDAETAKDAVAQAFYKAVTNAALLEAMPEPSMRAWLYAAARNAAVDIKRKDGRLRALDEDMPQPQADLTDRVVVDALMGRLPNDLRRIVALRYFGGLNSTEIGDALGMPAATVRTRLRKALDMMRVHLKGGER